MFGWKAGDSAWQQACEEADRLDPGWRWDDLLARRPVLGSDDARQVALAAAAALPASWPNWDDALLGLDLIPARLDSSLPSMKSDAAQALENELAETPRNRRLSPTAKRAIVVALSKAPEALRLARLIPGREIGRAPAGKRPVLLHLPDQSFMPTRRVAELLTLQARLTSDEGNVDDALGHASVLLVLAEAVCEPPMLMSILIGFAIRNLFAASVERSLGQGAASVGVLELLQQMVEAAAAAPLLLLGMRGERAINEDYVRAVENGSVTRQQIAEQESTPTIFLSGWRAFYQRVHQFLFRGFSKRQEASILRYYTAIVELLKESVDAPQRFPKRMRAIRKATPLSVQGSQSGSEMLFSADRQQRAKLHAVACALAAERFRMISGTWPDRLVEMVPDYLSCVPVDPFDLQPMRHRRTSDGIVIYSLGQDNKDSGGDIHSGGYQPPDIGIRLWNLDCRRLPPSDD